MIFEEKTIKSEIVYEGPVFRVRKHLVETVNGGESVRDIVEHSGGSILVAIEKALFELPAGKADPGEIPEVTAVRELQEETGYTAGSVKKMLTFYPTCGYSAETLHIYICRDLIPGEKHWDDSECIEIYEFYPDELIGMIMRNEIKDAKTIIGLLFARQAGEI